MEFLNSGVVYDYYYSGNLGILVCTNSYISIVETSRSTWQSAYISAVSTDRAGLNTNWCKWHNTGTNGNYTESTVRCAESRIVI